MLSLLKRRRSASIAKYASASDSVPAGTTFTRATTATYPDAAGVTQTAAINVLRTGAYFGGNRTVLLENASTNLVVQSGSLVVASGWALDVGTETLTQGVADPMGGTAGTTITPNASTSSGLFRAVTFTGDGVKSVACYIKQGTSTTTDIGLFDSTASAFRGQVRATWSAGVPTLSTISGTVTLFAVEAQTSGWYRVSFAPSGVVAANTNQLHLFPDKVGGTASSTFFGPMATDLTIPSSYVPTVGATVTRAADLYTVPFTALPQAMTLYQKLLDRGSSVSSSRTIQIGGTNTNSIRIVGSGVQGSFNLIHDDGAASVASAAVGGGSFGDTYELLAQWYADGSVQLSVSRNGGAATVGTQSIPKTLPATFGASTLSLNSRLDGAGTGFAAYLVPYKVAYGVKSLAEMRAL